MKRAVLAVAFTALGLICLQAQGKPNTVSLSIEEIARRAQSRNLEILKSRRSVEQAQEDLLGEPELMGSRLAVGGGYTSGGWYGQSSLSLPIIPQLSLGGEISVDEAWQFGEELTLSVEPFASGRQTYTEENLRYSQTVPITMYEEKNSGCNLPAQIDIYATPGEAYKFLFVAKGNRTQQVTDACAKHGGFYLGSIGGPAAILAQNNIRKVEVLDYPELGMEAIWKIEVEDFPAFILVDDKGNDFFKML